ncbi:MAG: class I SAM-dependent methyltransferase [Deltaproteobacteria bacterium]
MNAELIDEMARREESHWYFRSRRHILKALLSEISPRGPILDVGSGTGGNAEFLRPFGEVIGVDRSILAARGASVRGYSSAIVADGHRLPFPHGACPTVSCFDVLEHMDDDRAAVSELARICAPGGFVVATVPAYQWLWSKHDLTLGHRRRYRRHQVKELLEASGLRVRRLTYCLFGAFLPAIGVRLTQRALSGPFPSEATTDLDRFWIPRSVNDAIASLLSREADWVARRDLPVGLSIFVVGEKRG